MTLAKRQHTVSWLQVWGLAAVQAAIALMWVIYNVYLPALLAQFGFPLTVATAILIGENLLSSLIEPVMGSVSDRMQQSIGTRLPLISLGVIVASACFIAIPTVAVLGGSLTGVFRWVLPVMLVAWALTMSLFRSPVLSLLGQYAFATQLPQAASLLTLVGAMVGAMDPFSSRLILQLGPALTFTIGSLVLLGAVAILRTVHSSSYFVPIVSPSIVSPSIEPTAEPKLSPVRLALVFAVGLTVAVGFRLLMQTFPKVLQAEMPEANTPLILGLISIAIVLAAIPCGILATRVGGATAMLTGLGAMAIGLALLLFVKSVVFAALLAIGLGIAFSLVSNGSIPFALSMVPAQKAGLGTGIFFSGGAIGGGLLFKALTGASLTDGALMGTGAFCLAGIGVALANAGRFQKMLDR